MTIPNKKVMMKLTLLFLVILLPARINAEIIKDNVYNFSLDIPEGYKLTDASKDGTSYLFVHPNNQVQLALKIYDTQEINTAPKALENALKKLNASYSIDNFHWNNSLCAISDFVFQLDKAYSGWAVAAPLKKKSSYITAICFVPSNKRQDCDQFIMSTLNSICVDDSLYCTPGIVVSYAYPSEGKKEVKLNINNKTVSTSLDNSDIEAANFLIDLEFSVLKLYSKHNLWKEAWTRYYRLIYRDSFERVKPAISDLFDVLYAEAKRKNPSSPDLYVAQSLLSWVQTFEYKRNNQTANTSDFTSLPALICGDGNDCDSRSLFICMCMRCMGYEALLLVSPEYSHALAAVEMNEPGQKYVLGDTGREFLMGETTAKVTWGMIAQDQADRTKWIPILLP
ncbi:MAG: hypothetical protein J5527_00035 [Treponema sp.]|nr:hypothetical protein [Treponema sp.]